MMKSNMILQFIKFGVVGVIATLVDMGVLVILTELFHVNVLVALAISFSVSVVVKIIGLFACFGVFYQCDVGGVKGIGIAVYKAFKNNAVIAPLRKILDRGGPKN